MKIVICSKGRAGNVKTLDLLGEFSKDEIFLFVEPQDFSSYEIYSDKATLITLDKNDGGIGYARNFALSYFKPDEIVWMLDDDIDKFQYKNLAGKMENNNNLRATVHTIINEMKERGLAVIGTRFSSVAHWGGGLGQIAISYFIDKSKIGEINYKKELFYNEDKYFLFELLKNKKKIGLTYFFFHLVSKTGERKGGVQSFAMSKKIESMQIMYRDFSDYCSWFIDSKGLLKLKLKWAKLYEDSNSDNK